jgi:hypothetical protein
MKRFVFSYLELLPARLNGMPKPGAGWDGQPDRGVPVTEEMQARKAMPKPADA